MEKFEYVGKTKDEAIENALEDLKLEISDVIIIEKEKKQGLFASKKCEIEVIKKSSIIEEVNEFLISVTKYMGIETQIEIKIRDNTVSMKMFSDNNNILIGKGGQTLTALQHIIRQMILSKYKIKMNILLDVENYKEKQIKNIEYLAKQTAREVSRTKIEAKLSPMNSYQRRIVHSILTNFRGVTTESVGTEPNRCIVIKPKEGKNNE